jgi:hypothetical protein
MLTEQVEAAVTLWICIREVLGSNLSRDIIYSDWCFSRFTLVPPDKLRDITLIRSLPLFCFTNPFQSSIHQTFYYSALYLQSRY